MLHHVHRHAKNFLMAGAHKHPIVLAALVVTGGVTAVKLMSGTTTTPGTGTKTAAPAPKTGA